MGDELFSGQLNTSMQRSLPRVSGMICSRVQLRLEAIAVLRHV